MQKNTDSKLYLTDKFFLVTLSTFVGLAAYFWFVCDDAYISYRYSKNLAEGFGLRYNLSASPPVEGYSNFLWVILGSIVHWSGLAIDKYMPVISIICGGLILKQTKDILNGLNLTIFTKRLSLLTLATFPPFFIWSTSGLATIPFALAWLITFRYLVIEKNILLALLGGLALSLLRAEGLAWVILIAILSLVKDRDLKSIVKFLAILGTIFGIYILWRYSYYQEFVPNTVTNKVGFGIEKILRGLKYATNFFLTFPFVILALLSSFCFFKKSKIFGLVFVTALTATLTYPIVIGGDFMTMFRFFIPATPLLIIGYSCLLNKLDTIDSKLCLGFASVIIAINITPAFNLHITPVSIRENFHIRYNTKEFRSEIDQWAYMKYNSERWQILGRKLKTISKPGDSLVAGAIGNVGFFSELEIYDRFGLVNKAVAKSKPSTKRKQSPGHEKVVQPSFFLSESPTYLGAYLLIEKNPDQIGNRIKTLDERNGKYGYKTVFHKIEKRDSRGRELGLLVIKKK